MPEKKTEKTETKKEINQPSFMKRFKVQKIKNAQANKNILPQFYPRNNILYTIAITSELSEPKEITTKKGVKQSIETLNVVIQAVNKQMISTNSFLFKLGLEMLERNVFLMKGIVLEFQKNDSGMVDYLKIIEVNQ